MSSIWEIIIESVTFDRVIMVATLFVALCTLIYSRNKDKKHIRSLIKRKKSQLEALEQSMKAGFYATEVGSLSGNIAALKADIEQLEEEL